MASREAKVQRTCLGCKSVQDPRQMVRYVISPQGEVVVDYQEKLPGRGAYTCISRQCIQAAADRRQFDRSFKGKNQSPAGEALVAELICRLQERIVGLIGMGRKSGQVVSGGNMVLSALKGADPIALVVVSEDISDGMAEKVTAKCRTREIAVFRLLTKGLLGQVLGKGERSVVAFKKCPLAESLRNELIRYKDIVGES